MPKGHIPFHERIGCSVEDAVAASGLGRTKIFELLANKRLESTLVDGRRVIIVASLRKLIEGDAASDPKQIASCGQQQTQAV